MADVISDPGLCAIPLHHFYRHDRAVEEPHLSSYLDEFVFRFNRRRSRSRGMVFYRVLELAVAHDPVHYRDLILNPRPSITHRVAPATRGRPQSLDRAPADRPWRSANAPSCRVGGRRRASRGVAD